MSEVIQIKSFKDCKDIISSPGYVLIDYYAVWCGPCRMIAPIIAKMATKYKNVKFYKVDVDEVAEVAQNANIAAMPTFKLFKDGKEAFTHVGAEVNKLTPVLEKHVGQAVQVAEPSA